MLASTFVYAGVVVALTGIVSLVRPLRGFGVRSRRAGALIAVAGVLTTAAALVMPVREHRAEAPTSRLDDYMPVWQFDERHDTYVNAPPARVFEAIRAVRADEILLFRTLTSMRRFGRPAPESILSPPDTKPILDVATSTGFVYLAQEAPREVVVGTVIVAPPGWRRRQGLTPDIFRKPLPPGFALATMNFAVKADGGGSRVTTETRVFANDNASRRAFSIYWRIIYPGSAIIRRMWLRAIRTRAERTYPRIEETTRPDWTSGLVTARSVGLRVARRFCVDIAHRECNAEYERRGHPQRRQAQEIQPNPHRVVAREAPRVWGSGEDSGNERQGCQRGGRGERVSDPARSALVLPRRTRRHCLTPLMGMRTAARSAATNGGSREGRLYWKKLLL